MSSIPHNTETENEIFDSATNFLKKFQVGKLLFQCNAGRFCKNTVYRFLNHTKTNWLRFTTLLSARMINDFMKPLTAEDKKDVFTAKIEAAIRRSASRPTQTPKQAVWSCHALFKKV